MPNLPQPFDARLVDPTQVGGQQLPVSGPQGHLVIIHASETTTTKDQTGGMLVCHLRIIEQGSPHFGKEGPYRLNLFNGKSQQAVEIAYRQLSALCHVTGVHVVQSSEQLHNIPFRAVVQQQEPPNSQYTQVVKVLDANGNEPKAGQAPNTGAPAPAPAASAPGAASSAWGQPPQQQPQSAPQGAQPPAGWGQQPGTAQQPQQPAAWGQQPQQPQQPAQQPGAPAGWGQQPAAPAAQGQPASGQWGQPQAAPAGQPPAGWGQPGAQQPGGAAPWSAPR